MKAFQKVIHLTTRQKVEVVDITRQVEHICQESAIQEGLLLVFPYHTSSAVYLSDSDHNLTDDFTTLLAQLVPAGGAYRHNEVDPKKNAAGHLKASLSGHHVTLPVSQGQLDLGAYQTIYYAEFDGCRAKEVLVKIIGE